jgi:hypothetical protein
MHPTSTSPPASECVYPPHGSWGGETLACGERVGDPNPATVQNVWYSKFCNIIPLRSWQISQVSLAYSHSILPGSNKVAMPKYGCLLNSVLLLCHICTYMVLFGRLLFGPLEGILHNLTVKGDQPVHAGDSSYSGILNIYLLYSLKGQKREIFCLIISLHELTLYWTLLCSW